MSTHKAVDNKALDQILLYSDNTLSRNKAVNSRHLRAPQLNCSENLFVEKRNGYHTFCFGVLHETVCHSCLLRVHLAE